MADENTEGPVIDLAHAIAAVVGLPVSDMYGYAVVFVRTDMEVGTVSTMTDPLEAITALATGIHNLSTRPVPDIVLLDDL